MDIAELETLVAKEVARQLADADAIREYDNAIDAIVARKESDEREIKRQKSLGDAANEKDAQRDAFEVANVAAPDLQKVLSAQWASADRKVILATFKGYPALMHVPVSKQSPLWLAIVRDFPEFGPKSSLGFGEEAA